MEKRESQRKRVVPSRVSVFSPERGLAYIEVGDDHDDEMMMNKYTATTAYYNYTATTMQLGSGA